jgi:hypothetical protein
MLIKRERCQDIQGLMIEGNDQGTASLLESSVPMVGSDYTIIGGVAARKPYSPTIQGRRKETPNRSLVVQLRMRGPLMSKRHLTLDPFGVGLSITVMMCNLMTSSTPLNHLWSFVYLLLPQSNKATSKYEAILPMVPWQGRACKD